MGAQVCDPTGTTWGACECLEGTDAGDDSAFPDADTANENTDGDITVDADEDVVETTADEVPDSDGTIDRECGIDTDMGYLRLSLGGWTELALGSQVPIDIDGGSTDGSWQRQISSPCLSVWADDPSVLRVMIDYYGQLAVEGIGEGTAHLLASFEKSDGTIVEAEPVSFLVTRWSEVELEVEAFRHPIVLFTTGATQRICGVGQFEFRDSLWTVLGGEMVVPETEISDETVVSAEPCFYEGCPGCLLLTGIESGETEITAAAIEPITGESGTDRQMIYVRDLSDIYRLTFDGFGDSTFLLEPGQSRWLAPHGVIIGSDGYAYSGNICEFVDIASTGPSIEFECTESGGELTAGIESGQGTFTASLGDLSVTIETLIIDEYPSELTISLPDTIPGDACVPVGVLAHYDSGALVDVTHQTSDSWSTHADYDLNSHVNVLVFDSDRSEVCWYCASPDEPGGVDLQVEVNFAGVIGSATTHIEACGAIGP